MIRCPAPKFECLDSGICHLSEHHKFWPRRMYMGRIAMAFRNLPENREVLPWCEHNELHNTTAPPPRPTTPEMLEAIREAGL